MSVALTFSIFDTIFYLFNDDPLHFRWLLTTDEWLKVIMI
jgi:hypothetical protein